MDTKHPMQEGERCQLTLSGKGGATVCDIPILFDNCQDWGGVEKNPTHLVLEDCSDG